MILAAMGFRTRNTFQLESGIAGPAASRTHPTIGAPAPALASRVRAEEIVDLLMLMPDIIMQIEVCKTSSSHCTRARGGCAPSVPPLGLILAIFAMQAAVSALAAPCFD